VYTPFGNPAAMYRVPLTCLGPESVDGDVGAPELLRHAQDAHAHAVLCHRVGHVIAEPPKVPRFQRLPTLEQMIVGSNPRESFSC
jgi:hypothetical protein